MVAEKKEGWFDISTLKEPFRLEGKDYGYEVAEQLGWQLPQGIYPTGGGAGLIGMWKALKRWKRWLDWI
jgi:threonine synthase